MSLDLSKSARHQLVIRVDGTIDDVAGDALLDAVQVAAESGDTVTIELRNPGNLTSSAVRDLAACAQLGAALHFVRRQHGS